MGAELEMQRRLSSKWATSCSCGKLPQSLVLVSFNAEEVPQGLDVEFIE